MGGIRYTWLRRCASVVAALACFLLFAPLQAGASPLNLTTSNPGDVTTFSIDVSYNSTSGVLTANATTDGNEYQVLDDNGYFFDPTTFSITANLNPATGALESGTILLSGAESFTADSSPLLDNGNYVTLLTGNLTAFGFPNTSNTTNVPLEFEFSLTGGALTGPGEPYYSATNVIYGGTILHTLTSSSLFTGSPNDWPQTSFSSEPGNSYSDTFPIVGGLVPEPSSFVLLMVGLLPLAWRLRRRGPNLT